MLWQTGRYCGRIVAIGLALGATTAARAGEVRFTLTNPAPQPVATVARVSLPVPPGALPPQPPARVLLGGKPLPAQARVITRHPDGAPRRVMLSFPVNLGAGESVEGLYGSGAPQVALDGKAPGTLVTDRWQVAPGIDRIELRRADGTLLAAIDPFGPVKAEGKVSTQVIESGPYFTWLRYDRPGEVWGQQVDVQVLRTGELRLTHRIQAKPKGDHWTPDFGWRLMAPGARVSEPLKAPARFLGRDPNSRFADEANADLMAAFTLGDATPVCVTNPLALRQNRGSFEVTQADGAVVVRSNRNEPVKELETEGLMIQEGAWRFSELVVAPVGRAQLAAQLDAPLFGHADWRAYDAVYHTGPPLEGKHPALRQCVEKFIFALQEMQMKGDDLGSMPWRWAPFQAKPDYTSPVRLNHALYVWEDWFRGGDPRMWRVAHDWCRNYFDLGMYWGPNPEFYGACRRGNAWRGKPGHGPGTFNPRFDNTPIYVHKGWSNFWLMYEETGDPRYRHAAEAAAEWSIQRQNAGLSYTRTIGVVADAVKMYEYTGEHKHLENAQRLYESFQPTQGEDLLFTESGKPAVGNDLYIGIDALGYKTPFVKPYIVQYATNALPYLLRHAPRDDRLRRTIVALNDWMARVQQPGGGWGYPHPAAAGALWSLEYTHGILLAHGVSPRKEYLEAAARILRPITQLCQLHGWPASGLDPWEFRAKINVHQRQELYQRASDRDPMRDYEEGRVRFGWTPDDAVYFQVVLRDYLAHRSEASLFESDALLEKIKRLPTSLPQADARLK
jgi:hypothetical protein